MAEAFNHESTPEEIQERTALDHILAKDKLPTWSIQNKEFQEMLDAQ